MSAALPTDPPAGRTAWWAGAAVALAAAAAYVPTLPAYFIGDDFGLIRVLHGKPLGHFFSLFTGSWTDNIYGVRPDELRPFIALAYQVDARFGAGSPLPYHVGSVVLHVGCSLLVWALARVAAGATRTGALLSGLLFAVHPAHSEAVAWISGRADSIPALFYLGAFLAYAAWRRRPSVPLLAASVALSFCALFSKQSAITLPFVLLAYEALVERRRGRPLGRWLIPVAPFAVLTAGYLVLRQVLFGNYVREQLLSFGLLRAFLRRQPAYVDALLTPAVVPVDAVTTRGLVLLVLAAAAAIAMAVSWWRHPEPSRERGALFFFGPVWYVATVGPLLVTYFSPRHLYLPSAGLAIAAGALLDLIARGRRREWRLAAVAAAGLLVAADAAALQRHNRRWNDAARASHALVTETHRVAREAPPGSLLLVDAPWRTRHAFVWGWALPFTLQPPFADEDLTQRVRVVGWPATYCCPQDAWLADSRRQVAAWSVEPRPVYVVSLDAARATTRTVSVDAAPGLREAAAALGSAATPAEGQARLQAAFALASRSVPPPAPAARR